MLQPHHPPPLPPAGFQQIYLEPLLKFHISLKKLKLHEAEYVLLQAMVLFSPGERSHFPSLPPSIAWPGWDKELSTPLSPAASHYPMWLWAQAWAAMGGVFTATHPPVPSCCWH